MKILYHYRYISILIVLFIIAFGIVKKHPFIILLGVCFLLLISIITITETITIKKWERIVKPLIDEIPEREEKAYVPIWNGENTSLKSPYFRSN